MRRNKTNDHTSLSFRIPEAINKDRQKMKHSSQGPNKNLTFNAGTVAKWTILMVKLATVVSDVQFGINMPSYLYYKSCKLCL